MSFPWVLVPSLHFGCDVHHLIHCHDFVDQKLVLPLKPAQLKVQLLLLFLLQSSSADVFPSFLVRSDLIFKLLPGIFNRKLVLFLQVLFGLLDLFFQPSVI